MNIHTALTEIMVLADSWAYRIVTSVGLDRPERSSICTSAENLVTQEILAQLEVTGGSVPLASKVKGRTVRLKLSQVNSASMDSFRCCTIDPGRDSVQAASQQVEHALQSPESKHSESHFNLRFRRLTPYYATQLHTQLKNGGQPNLDWLQVANDWCWLPVCKVME